MKICIIGGGTTGWWCASYMQKFLDANITLIESNEIPISGVGESTLPQIKTFFDELEIPESEWMKECNATYKVSIQFSNWKNGDSTDVFQYPFGEFDYSNGDFLTWYYLHYT